jgi:hypothetical protein
MLPMFFAIRLHVATKDKPLRISIKKAFALPLPLSFAVCLCGGCFILWLLPSLLPPSRNCNVVVGYLIEASIIKGERKESNLPAIIE